MWEAIIQLVGDKMSKLNSGEVFGIDSIAPLGHTVPDPDNPSGSEYIGLDGVKYAVYIPPSPSLL